MMVKQFSSLLFLGAILPFTSSAAQNCPLAGPDFPAPKNPSSSSTIRRALANLTQVLNQSIATSNSYGSIDTASTSFSLEIFSTHDTSPLFTRHSNAGNLANATSGTKNVDSDTTYRIGSLTKLFTVYTFLINAGDVKFNDPITKYIPELQEAADAFNATQDSLDYVAWEDVTVGELACQMAGIGRDYSGFGELELLGLTSPMDGVPPLATVDVAACAGGGGCSRAQFMAGFTRRHPVYAPGTAGIYSNAAFLLLSYALENITGADFPTLVQDSLFTPLNLSNGTSWLNPPVDHSTAVIPDGSSYTLYLGDETSAGGMYTSLNDATLIGRSILVSSLLRPAVTRRWLKPRVFRSDLNTGVGAPWEITRLNVGPNSRLVDLYTKSGDLPGYSSLMVLAPDWDVGFVILAAGGDAATTNVVVLADIIADVFLPTVEDAAREEAGELFAGPYADTNGSSIVLSTDPAKPGLGVDSWISGYNNTDVLASSFAGPDTRLYPSGLSHTLANGDVQMGFRAVFENLEAPQQGVVFGSRCVNWATVDTSYWGSVSLDEFLVTVDGATGKGKSVTSRGLRTEMARVS